MSLFDSAMDPSARQGPSRRLLSFLWPVIYAAGLVANLWSGRGHPAWVWVLSGIALLAWILRVLTSNRLAPLQIALEAVMAIAGGIACVPGDVLSGVPLAVVFVLTLGYLKRPVWVGVTAIPVALASIGVGTVLYAGSLTAVGVEGRLTGSVALVVIAVLVGISRRQTRMAERRTEELAVERRRAERLDDHATVARDLHDVLAHGLGGLVIQLDAVDALLESGRTSEAAEKVRAARALAVEGLNDARRAVDALRDDADAAPVSAADLVAMLRELLDAHRALGGNVTATLDAGSDPVPAAQAGAFRRTLQEALSNARKHAAAEPVEVTLSAAESRLELTVSNPLGPSGDLAATGGGRGLAGMRERFAELPGGAVEAKTDHGRFTVHAGAAR